MRILRYMVLSLVVAAFMSAGFYGCAAKQEVAEEGAMMAQPADEGMDMAAGDAAKKTAEAPPGPSEQPEPVETPRPEKALKDVYFDFDRFDIKASEAAVLKVNAAWLKDNPDTIVTIEGHCDERGTVEYNLALGERRAQASKDYLVSLGIDSSRMKIISYGKSKPADPGHDEAAWAKNRRAHFVVQ